MKKRLIIFNSIIIFISLSLFLIITILIFNYHNNQSSKKQLKEYINLTSEIFTGSNYSEIIEIMKNTNEDVRITFISFDGEVISDTSNKEYFDNHINRPEIINLGDIYTRYSDSLEVNMIYIANSDDGLYVRVAMPLKSIKSVVRTFLIFWIITLISLTILSLILLEKINKVALMPLNKVVKKLSTIVGDEQLDLEDNVEAISNQIDDINNLINQKISDIIDEKSKVDFIINNINQGILVIDSEMNIVLVNDFFLDLKGFKKEEVLNKNYLYLIRDVNLQNNILASIDNGNTFLFDVKYKSRTYLININLVNNKWTVRSNGKNGVIVLALDVTDVRNVEQMKREFFDNASHELKSPLTTIIGYQQMIIEGIINTPEEIFDATTRTIKEANRMHQTILEMLELSKLESSEEIKIEKVNIKNIINETIESFKKEITDKNINLKINLEDFEILINNYHLSQLIRNLLDNAIKYNKVNGTIEIATLRSDKAFIIKDTGIGISEENQSRIFERFYRVDKARSKELGGTGLGLAIVKHICSKYNYKIELTSKVNKGTTIKIIF